MPSLKYNNNHYNKTLKHLARNQRNNLTKAEEKVWKELLQNRKMLGYKFHRQRPIGHYIADFFCKELKLVIEIDGLTHTFEETVIKDRQKETFLLENGYHVLRFDDHEVMSDLENVYRTIQNKILLHT